MHNDNIKWTWKEIIVFWLVFWGFIILLVLFDSCVGEDTSKYEKDNDIPHPTGMGNTDTDFWVDYGD